MVTGLIGSWFKVLNIFSVCSWLKKYFGWTFFSKISDNEHSFSFLRDTEVFCVENLPPQRIPRFGKRNENVCEIKSSPRAKNSFNVFKDKISWFFFFEATDIFPNKS